LRIYELAKTADKKSSEILSLARSLGFEVKTASSSITQEEAEAILKELESSEKSPVISSDESSLLEVEAEKKSEHQSSSKKGSWLDDIEAVPKVSKPPEVVTTGRSKAFLVYRILTVVVTLLFVFLGFTAINANRQGAQLTENVNATTKLLTDNQKVLDKKIEALNKEIQTLKDSQTKAKEADKKAETNKKPTAAPQKTGKQASKK
jgi:translation initiation factor IF-2